MQSITAYLIRVVCLRFLKTIFCFEKKENKESIWNMFDSFFFFFFVPKNTENTKNTKLKGKKQFSKNTKIVLFLFSKTIIMNNFKKQNPNMY